jgi:hypothetical protein
MNLLITKCKFNVNEWSFFNENQLILFNILILLWKIKSVSRCQL